MTIEENDEALVVELYAQQFNWKAFATLVMMVYWEMPMLDFFKILTEKILLGLMRLIQMVLMM